MQEVGVAWLIFECFLVLATGKGGGVVRLTLKILHDFTKLIEFLGFRVLTVTQDWLRPSSEQPRYRCASPDCPEAPQLTVSECCPQGMTIKSARPESLGVMKGS